MNNANRPTFYMVCGYPFAGKTTLTKRLAAQLGFAQVSIDDIKAEHGYADVHGDDLPADVWQTMFQESYDRALTSLRAGTSALHDARNMNRYSRDRDRAAIEPAGFPTKVIFVDVPESVVRARWSHNKETAERFALPNHIFQAGIDSLEPPAPDEHLIVYHPSEPFDQWIARHWAP